MFIDSDKRKYCKTKKNKLVKDTENDKQKTVISVKRKKYKFKVVNKENKEKE